MTDVLDRYRPARLTSIADELDNAEGRTLIRVGSQEASRRSNLSRAQRERAEQRWQQPGAREEHARKIKAAWEDPAKREAHSERMQQVHAQRRAARRARRRAERAAEAASA